MREKMSPSGCSGELPGRPHLGGRQRDPAHHHRAPADAAGTGRRYSSHASGSSVHVARSARSDSGPRAATDAVVGREGKSPFDVLISVDVPNSPGFQQPPDWVLSSIRSLGEHHRQQPAEMCGPGRNPVGAQFRTHRSARGGPERRARGCRGNATRNPLRCRATRSPRRAAVGRPPRRSRRSPATHVTVVVPDAGEIRGEDPFGSVWPSTRSRAPSDSSRSSSSSRPLDHPVVSEDPAVLQERVGVGHVEHLPVVA